MGDEDRNIGRIKITFSSRLTLGVYSFEVYGTDTPGALINDSQLGPFSFRSIVYFFRQEDFQSHSQVHDQILQGSPHHPTVRGLPRPTRLDGGGRRTSEEPETFVDGSNKRPSSYDGTERFVRRGGLFPWTMGTSRTEFVVSLQNEFTNKKIFFGS